MEDSNKMKAQLKGAPQDKGRVVDLTPEMETAPGAKAKIIELTQVFKSPPAKPAPATEPASTLLAETGAAPESHQPLDAVDTPNVEADVDAAFEAMKRSAPHQSSDDAAVALSTIAESALSTPTSTSEPELELTVDEVAADEPLDGAKKEPQSEADDTAGPQAMAPDKTLDLTDIVQPIDLQTEAAEIMPAEGKTTAETGSSTAAPAGGQEEIIELGDAAQPMDAQEHSGASGLSAPGEDDVLGLADIVAPDQTTDTADDEAIDLTDIALEEGAGAAAGPEPDEAIELIDIADPDERAITPEEDDEEIIELRDVVPADPENDAVIELADIVDPEQATDTADDEAIDLTDIALEEEAGAAAEPEPDGAIALTDIVDPDDRASTREEDEETIELTDVVPSDPAGSENDAAIELTDIVDPDRATDTADDEAIDLTDIALEEEAGAAAEPEPDGAIALTDIVEPDERAGTQEEDEEIIELTDVVRPEDAAAESPAGQELEPLADEPAIEWAEQAEATSAAASAPADGEPSAMWSSAKDAGGDKDPADLAAEVEEALAPPMAEEEQPPAPATDREPEDEVIRLDSVLSHLRENRDTIERDITLGVEEELFNTAAPGDGREEQLEAKHPADREIEKTIEKILTTKYAQTIETLIAKVVEKVVTREIESIKRNLMEGED